MDWLDRLRAKILSTIVRDLPKSFWEDARNRTRQTYLDIFHEVAAYPNVIMEQRLEMLHSMRFIRMEHLLSVLAAEHGLKCSPTILAENHHGYVYATKGAIGLTQTYVSAIGEMPQPARFRERLAAMNGIPNTPRFDFGDEPREVLLRKDFYGLLAHNPVGKRFTETDQRLGMVQFCVPVEGCSRWALQITVQEIISEYGADKSAKKADRRLPWKDRREDKKDKKGKK